MTLKKSPKQLKQAQIKPQTRPKIKLEPSPGPSPDPAQDQTQTGPGPGPSRDPKGLVPVPGLVLMIIYFGLGRPGPRHYWAGLGLGPGLLRASSFWAEI